MGGAQHVQPSYRTQLARMRCRVAGAAVRRAVGTRNGGAVMRLHDIACAAGLTPYEWSGSYCGRTPAATAERLTDGKTHYYSASTRRFHGASVSKLRVIADGMALAAIERVSLDMNHTRKGYRVVIHDLTGTVINDRLGLDPAHKGLAAAQRDFEAQCEKHSDGAAILREAIANETRTHKRALDALITAAQKLREGEAL